MKLIYGSVAFLLLSLHVFTGAVAAQGLTSDQSENAVVASDTRSEDTYEEVTAYYFEDKLCSVCAQQSDFLDTVEDEYPSLNVVRYDISETDKFQELAAEQGLDNYQIMAPTTFIGDEFLQFSSFGAEEEDALRAAIEGREQPQDTSLRLPLIGTRIDTSTWSLPLLAIVLGTLDGFNVCSLGALILILTIVLAFDSRKKIFLFGGLFILTTVIVYGALVFVWGQLINTFIGQLSALRFIVGLAALAASAWFFREFWRFYKYGPTCETSNLKLARISSQKLKSAFEDPGKGTAMLASAIILFAVAITIVELPCSIGVPIAFTGILVQSGASLGMYTVYILLYLFFYMLIELIVFTGAVLTKEIWFAGSKLITWTTFVGAVILLLLGLYYLLAV